MTNHRSYIDEDGEALELDEQFFKEAKRGRPALAPEQRKRQVTMMLDPDVIDHFKKEGRGWQTRMNAALRKVAGLS
jgi:uncharacterized protein (DUF4415 family)